MKRDNDLLRDLLFEMEAQDEWLALFPGHSSMSPEARAKLGHVYLLCDAELLVQVSEHGFRMTNLGFDYLEAVRSNDIWERTKSGAAAVGGMTLGMMRDLAVAYVKKEAAAKLGIEF